MPAAIINIYRACMDQLEKKKMGIGINHMHEYGYDQPLMHHTHTHIYIYIVYNCKFVTPSVILLKDVSGN